MKIAILTLTGQRDEFIDHALAEKLRKYGHEVNIRNYIYAGRETVCYEKPDVVIHPMPGGQYKYDFIEQCKGWGCVVIVRRGEAGMGRDQFDELDDNRKSIILGNWDYSQYVDMELTWGQEFSDIIAEQGHMPAEKIKACGAFAFDSYFIDHKDLSADRKKTILFATGFSTCDCRSEYCELGIEEDSEYHKEIYAIHRKARDTWIEAIKELVRWFGDEWAFELKVRPGEMTEEYEKTMPDAVKIHRQRTPSSEVLRHTDILVHSGSTMAIEAHLLGIPSFNFCNVNPDPLLSQVSPMLETYEELEFNLCRATPGRSNINDSVLGQLQEHLYGPIDGKACERAAGFVHEHIKGKQIETNIPDVWPKTTKYLAEDIHLEKQEGDVLWVCPCCRNSYFSKLRYIARCPYCSMQIERKGAEHLQGVIK